MLKKLVKLLSGIMVITICTGAFVGCSGNTNTTTKPETNTNEQIENNEKVEEENGEVVNTEEVEEQLKLTLKGEQQIQIEEGQSFEDPGVTVNKEAKVIRRTFLDVNKPGIYEICYTAEDTKGEIDSVVRVVEVVKKVEKKN